MAAILEASDTPVKGQSEGAVTPQSVVKAVDDDLDQQRELFLWKFKDVSREDIDKEYVDFLKHDLRHKGELDEHETLMFLEHREATLTAMELRNMLTEIDKDKNRKVNFLEWCCFYFKKSYEVLNDFVDEEARERAMAEARAAGEKAKAAKIAIEEAKKREEEEAARIAAEVEKEKDMAGVKGAAARFARVALNSGEKDNMQKIKEESARKRALREAKKAEEAAHAEAAKTKSAEEVQAEIAENARIAKEKEEAAKKAAKDKEIAERKARIAARNAAFNDGSHFKNKKEE